MLVISRGTCCRCWAYGLLWDAVFGTDPAIVNKKVLLDAVPHTVIGVMPPTFSFLGSSTLQLWTPIYRAKSPALMKFGTRPFDLAVFGAVTATLLAVAALACAVPSWRAAHLDPMQALRTE